MSKTTEEKWFDDIKKEILKVDPVAFCEHYLKVDGSNPLKLNGTGWKFLADVYRYVAIKALEPTGKPVVCVKGRQVGATTMATALELYFTTSGLFGGSPERPPMRILHCFPKLSQVQKFAKDKLSTMMRTSTDEYVTKQSLAYDEKLNKKRSDLPDDTLTEKQFKGENRIWVDSNGNDASRLQGLTLDAIFYDEVQKMMQDDIGNSKRTLTASRYGPKGQGIQLYFGTPLQKGSYFHKMWENSDKRFYFLKCANCDKHFQLYKLGSDDWFNIWLYENIVECPHCKYQQDKAQAVENGQWIPTGDLDAQYVGFHFNQLLIPYFTKEHILREHPDNSTNSDRVWRNEILGEFYSGLDLPLSEEDIKQNARDTSRSISFGTPKVTDGSGFVQRAATPVFLGADWGGKSDDPKAKGGKSFSCIVLLSLGKNGVLNIENAFKLRKNDLDHKIEVINEMYRRFNIKIGVADWGYGNDTVTELQKEYGDRFLSCMNNGSLINPYKYDKDDLRLMCNHHKVLDDVFKDIRKGKITFPWQSYEQIQWLIEHCTSMEKEDAVIQGREYTRYVKGSGPNDGLMALMYGYLGYKFYQTKGFNMKAFEVEKQMNKPIAAYLPGV